MVSAKSFCTCQLKESPFWRKDTGGKARKEERMFSLASVLPWHGSDCSTDGQYRRVCVQITFYWMMSAPVSTDISIYLLSLFRRITRHTCMALAQSNFSLLTQWNKTCFKSVCVHAHTPVWEEKKLYFSTRFNIFHLVKHNLLNVVLMPIKLC